MPCAIDDAVGRSELVVFDLDNTLIDEEAWLAAAYEAVSKVAAPDDAHAATVIARSFLTGFQTHGRTGLFERIRSEFPGLAGDTSTWLAAMRTAEVNGGLTIAPWAQSLCQSFSDKPMAILTNGNVIQQQNKYRQLVPSWARTRFRLYCLKPGDEQKPSPRGLFAILSDFNCKPEQALFLGDTTTDRE